MTSSNSEPAIFKRYPELCKTIPWQSLGLNPTPVEPLEGFGRDNLWMKRDDLTSSLYGGNKIRKLEFALGEVLKKQKKRVVTLGGTGTNHGLATAIFCSELGLDCTVILFDQPITRNVKRNLQLLHDYRAEIIYRGPFFRALLEFFIRQRVRRPLSYFLYPGGSSVLGTTGFVNAAFELKEQIDNGQMAEPSCIFCPVGSNGTMAGLILGAQLAGLNSRIVGVRVSYPRLGPIDICSAKAVQKLARDTYTYLRKQGADLPPLTIPMPTLLEEYLGEGYGYPTPEACEAFRLMEANKGITLDPCYTSKAFAALLDHCKEDRDPKQPLLFWNTYNSAELLKPSIPGPEPEVPPKVRLILDAEEVAF
jgi:D-cysteine desulfhydrase